MIKFTLKALFILFLFFAILTGFLANVVWRGDQRQVDTIERAIELSQNRLPQARELFYELRPELELLADSEELHLRRVYFLPSLLYDRSEDVLIFRSQWDSVPWITPDELLAIDTLLFKDIEGARDRSVNFSENGLTVIIYATPFHSLVGVSAWLGFSYLDSVLLRPEEHHVVYFEPLDDVWYLTIISIVPTNKTIYYIVAMCILFSLALISLGILIWGNKTKRLI